MSKDILKEFKPPYEVPEYMKPLLKVRSKKEWDDFVHRCLYGRGRTHNLRSYYLLEEALEKK